MMIDSKLDLGNKRNLIIASVILVIGIGEATLKIGNLDLHGMALAALIGIVLNLVLPADKDETINKETA